MSVARILLPIILFLSCSSICIVACDDEEFDLEEAGLVVRGSAAIWAGYLPGSPERTLSKWQQESGALNIQLVHFVGGGHDKFEALARVAAHEVGDGGFCDEAVFVVDLHLQQVAAVGVQSGGVEGLWVHLA